MLGIQDLSLFIVAGLALNITPGQDTIYIVGRSAAGGLRAGVAAALGIGAGCLFHVAAAVLGLSALLASSATLFNALKMAGAAYLAWVALGMLRSAWRRGRADPPANPAGRGATVNAPPGPLHFWPVLRQGCLTNVLNPKVALFFLAFLPQFVSRDAPHPALAMALLGAIFCVNGTLWCLFVAWSAARLARRIGPGARLGAALEALGGTLMLWLAARLALSDAR